VVVELKPCLVVTTHLGLERVAASRIKEEFGVEAEPMPGGFQGLIIVYCQGFDVDLLTKELSSRVVEAERVLPIYRAVKADLEEICEAVRSLAPQVLGESESFAVRTERRGHHSFTSIDVNVKAGACVQSVRGNPVDLENPDKIFWVEVLGDTAYVSVTPGSVVFRKSYDRKPNVLVHLRKIVIGQVPYLADAEASYKVGVRIGRAVQSFEVKELVITPYTPVDARPLAGFIRGVLEGIDSRYSIQTRSYSRKVHRVPVNLFDLYQLVRDYRERNIPIIATSTKGRYVGEVKRDVRRIFENSDKVLVLIGSREGLPTGVLRFSDLVIDVLPGVTLATDVAAPSILTAIAGVLAEESND